MIMGNTQRGVQTNEIYKLKVERALWLKENNTTA